MKDRGSLAEHSLTSLLEGVQTERATGSLTVKSNGHGCTLFFLFGHLFHAQGKDSNGDEAVLAALRWQAGEFVFDPAARMPAVETVKSSIPDLVTAAAQAGPGEASPPAVTVAASEPAAAEPAAAAPRPAAHTQPPAPANSPAPAPVSGETAHIHRYAAELVEETRRANERRLAGAQGLAAAFRVADEAAAQQVIAAAEEANARDLKSAQRQADDVIRQAKAGILAAAQRHAESLVEDARRANAQRVDRNKQLIDLFRLTDAGAAERFQAALEEADRNAVAAAEKHAQKLVGIAQAELSGEHKPHGAH